MHQAEESLLETTQSLELRLLLQPEPLGLRMVDDAPPIRNVQSVECQLKLPSPRSLLTTVALLCASCLSNTASPGVFLATDPPGARVYVDGADSGFATPCSISLNKTVEHEVAFLLDGYEIARRELYPSTHWTVVPWSDGELDVGIWRFPLFLTLEGLLFPFGEDDNLVPSRVYVPLEIATEEN